MEPQINSNSKVYALVLTGLMAALVLAATSVFRIPVPATNGYVHLGDAMIFVAVLMLGRKNGTIAGAAGSALADLLGGYAHWVPWTFAIKALMAFAFGTLLILLADRYDRSRIHSISDHMKKQAVLAENGCDGINGNSGGICAGSADTMGSIETLFAMALSSLIMIAGYFIAQRIIYGNLAAPLAALPGNIVQAAAGVIIASVISAAIRRAAPQMLN